MQADNERSNTNPLVKFELLNEKNDRNGYRRNPVLLGIPWFRVLEVRRRTSMTLEKPIEPFVDAAKAAEFLSIKPRRLLDLARAGKIPAHPLGDGKRRVWRFRFSELAHSMGTKVIASGSNPSYGSTQAVPGRVR
jgi:hypothetical protein